MKVAAIVLAAGASRRLGEPKQLVQLAGERLLERAVRTASEAGCHPVLCILGAHAAQIEAACALGAAQVILNAEWAEGMASSIRAGLRALPFGLEGFVLMTCDQPAVSAQHLRALIGLGELAGSHYAGRCGVPAFIPVTRSGELERLVGDTGARELLRQARALPLAGGELDVDDQESFERVRQAFG